ncbi:DUF6385 domain-containing protein [Paenibacillus sp. SI8]|uniref:DUF6385 domain-containing protein n=1 Tax=unclassified Paenibacillus TaxID=185978 RepID=UPI0034651849
MRVRKCLKGVQRSFPCSHRSKLKKKLGCCVCRKRSAFPHKKRMKPKPSWKKRCCNIYPIIKKLRVRFESKKFIEDERLNVLTGDDWKPSLQVNSSLLSLYSYSVVNRGQYPSEIKVEISPNGSDFMRDSQLVVAPGATQVIVPIRYLKYTRFSVKSQKADQPTRLDIYFQAQTAG